MDCSNNSPEDFQEVEVKEEPLEYNTVSCEAILAWAT